MIFSWIPDAGPTNTPKDNVIEIEFGDGYFQRQKKGMNSQSDNWSFSFNNRPSIEGKEIVDFLKARGGVESFDFVPPGEEDAKKFVCRTGQWSYRVLNGGRYAISAKFDQVFEP